MPRWIKFTSPSTSHYDAYIEVDSSDIIYITKHQDVWEVIYFPQHGIRKVMYSGHSKAKAREWLNKFLAREKQKDRERSWVDNEGQDYDGFIESKFAENSENQ